MASNEQDARRLFRRGGGLAAAAAVLATWFAAREPGQGECALPLGNAFRECSATAAPPATSTLAPVAAGLAVVGGPWRSLPLAFVENLGQWDTPARFVARQGGMTVRVEPDALVLQLVDARRKSPASVDQGFKTVYADSKAETTDPRRGAVVRLAFEHASPEARIRGSHVLPGHFNYFLGNDPSRWRTRVPGYGVVTCEDIQEGVDLVLHEQNGQLEYDVCLAPGARLEDIVIRCEGVYGLHLDEQGSLVLSTPLGPLEQRLPTTWEETPEGERIPVACRYRLLDDRRYGFEVEARNSTRRLVIDPGLTWATLLGGMWADAPVEVTVTANGDVITAGSTDSSNFPTTPGAYDPIGNAGFGSADQLVTRLTADGSALVYSTFLGGTDGETVYGMFVDDQERFTLVGKTFSSDYPTTPGAYQGVFAGQNSDAVVAQISSAGDALLYSTFLGGFNAGTASEVAVDVVVRSDGTLIVSGSTCAPDFPVTPDALDPTFQPLCDGFLCLLDPAASGAAQLVYSSFFFGGGFLFMTREADGSILGVGHTGNPAFPITAGAFDSSFEGGFSGAAGIACRLSPDLKTILASTFLDVEIEDVAFGPPGSITLVANNIQLTLLTPGSYDPTFNGSADVIAGRLSDSLTQWEWGTLIGGSQIDGAYGVAVDPSGAVIITGTTSSPDYPVTPGAHDTSFSGGLGDACVSCLSSDGSQLLYSTYLGASGAASMRGQAVAATGLAEAVVVGDGANSAFPVTPGAFDTTYNGGIGDGFVARLLLNPAWASIGAGIAGTNGVPKLIGDGALCAGGTTTLTLIRGKPNGVATLVIGLALLQTPFKGGTLIPTPDILLYGLPLSSNGVLVLSAPWPAGIPAGFAFHFQAWIADAVAVQGFAATNGLSATTP